MKTFRIAFELDDDDIQILARQSGRLRDEPRKPWTQREYKDHAKITIQRLVGEYLAKVAVTHTEE